MLLHQLAELALAHDGVVNAQPGKFDLAGLVIGDGHIADHPVIQRPVRLELQGAETVGDALQSVLDGVGKVVHGIDAPLGALAVVVDEADAVDDGVPEVQIAAGQVDLGRRVILPSSTWPFFIFSNRRRFSSMGRSR